MKFKNFILCCLMSCTTILSFNIVQNHKAVCAYEQGDYHKALDYFQTALLNDPYNYEYN